MHMLPDKFFEFSIKMQNFRNGNDLIKFTCQELLSMAVMFTLAWIVQFLIIDPESGVF